MEILAANSEWLLQNLSPAIGFWRRRTKLFAGDRILLPAKNFHKEGGDVKGCMLNTGVGHSASASYSLLLPQCWKLNLKN